MLDTDTKRRIDTARDILVGKLPDPKSQIEQITIALIYKFMDDMDKESVELGGKVKFFTGDFEKYGWSKIFDPRLGGYDIITLYSEAILKMNQNNNIPQLFRDIFKNAYLPYRDPETLKSFLKTINEFQYDHSEKLGDAFEYLLSVMGSQGEAGQFRTPRHIIDFMANVVAPRKDESVLDPACGTAGFLISAYKYILKTNSSDFHDERVGLVKEGEDALKSVINGNGYKGDLLNSDEKKRLIDNFVGYDISPDMVRLSLVNMYLHGFLNPKIYEYDTLSSEEKWQDVYDVIMANPPFMSPKGGIRPHKKFSIQAKRSEVLFVDYIHEHLNPNGRAGIIVPEGIIFQTGTAYKDLRKMLLEDSLYAVISLPAGVFNPYSGVKTSILLLDKNLVKKTKDILFVKINNDGYNLGAQRREIKENDLPVALDIIKKFQKCVREGKECELNKVEQRFAHIVSKDEINDDSILSGDRYRQEQEYSGKWDFVKISEICDLKGGGTPSRFENSYWEGGNIKWISSKHINNEGRIIGNEFITEQGLKNSSTNIAPKNSTIIISRVSVGKIAYADDNYAINQDLTALIRKNEIINDEYLFFIAKKLGEIVERNAHGLGVRGVTRKFISDLQIPLPPLEIQEQIVSEIESYQNIIDGAKKVVENYRPSFKIEEEWETTKLEKVCTIQSGGTPGRNNKVYWDKGSIPWVGSAVCKDKYVTEAKEFITEEGLKNSSTKLFQPNTTLIALVGATIGKTGLLTFECSTNQNIAGLYPKDEDKLTPKFVFYAVQRLYPEFLKLGEGKFRMANLSFIKTLDIPLPPLETQKQIVAQIEEEQKLVEANKRLVEIFDKKVKDKIAEVWGEND